MKDSFDLTGKVIVITGGAGLLGIQHAIAIRRFGGIPIVTDIDEGSAKKAAIKVGGEAGFQQMDVTKPESVAAVCDRLEKEYGQIHGLVNNAARNPKVETGDMTKNLGRFEDQDLASWTAELNVGLTGAMLCSQRFGSHMAKMGEGVILNIASDLAIFGPDQRLYSVPGRSEEEQPKKPVSYSVVKTGLVGLTRYLATYWADKGVRANALCPGGVENGQPDEFVSRLRRLIPMDRMARVNEYHGAVVFLCSEASAYMTGQIMTLDGGRSTW